MKEKVKNLNVYACLSVKVQEYDKLVKSASTIKALKSSIATI